MTLHKRIDWFFVRLFWVFRYYHPADVQRGPISYWLVLRLNRLTYRLHKLTSRWLALK